MPGLDDPRDCAHLRLGLCKAMLQGAPSLGEVVGYSSLEIGVKYMDDALKSGNWSPWCLALRDERGVERVLDVGTSSVLKW